MPKLCRNSCPRHGVANGPRARMAALPLVRVQMDAPWFGGSAMNTPTPPMTEQARQHYESAPGAIYAFWPLRHESPAHRRYLRARIRGLKWYRRERQEVSGG